MKCSSKSRMENYSFSLNRQDEQKVESQRVRTDSDDRELQSRKPGTSVFKVFRHLCSLGPWKLNIRALRCLQESQKLRLHPLFFSPAPTQKASVRKPTFTEVVCHLKVRFY